MSEEYPLHGAVWAKQLVEHLKRRGFPVSRLLSKVEVHPRILNAEDARLSMDKVVAIFEQAAEITGDDSIGFHFAQTCDPTDGGLFGYVGLSAPTLADLLMNLSKYSRVFSDATVLDVSKLHTDGQLEVHWSLPANIKRRQHSEWGATALLHAIRMYTNRTVYPVGVRLQYPRNANIEEYEKYFGCSIRFGSAVNCITFKLEDLQMPLVTADRKLNKVLRNYCETVLAENRGRTDTIVNRVERQIADRLSKHEASIEKVATALGMSTRTLSRRLKEAGTTFKDILDDYRKAIALRYLENDDLGMTQIAFLLGYTEVSSFNHSCKRWTGRTPTEVRASS